MRISTALFISFLLCFLFHSEVFSQCSTTQCNTPVPAVNAQDACILPNPQALDCYYGTTTPDPPISFPPYWCTVIHNNHWFAFTADATTATFSISCWGCAVGNGIQAAVLSTLDCINFTFVSACLGNIPTGTTSLLTATGLTPGEVYYICIDGSGGALCDYSINGSLPTVVGPTDGLCLPSTPAVYTATTNSTWSINPPQAGTIIGSQISTSITVNWTQAGPAEVCAQNLNCPNAPIVCLPVVVGEDVSTTEVHEVCQGQKVSCAGRNFSSNGTFPVKLSTYLGCDSIVNCEIHVIPTVYSTETVNICQNGEATCAGEQFYAPGNYPVKLTAWQGCDSVVNCQVKLVPTYSSPVQIVNLCGPAMYQVCDDVYESTGIYSHTCTGYLGCDSIVNFNLAILEPQAVIAPPLVLDCDSNLVITLNGSGSSINTASSGITLYHWTGPGIISAANQPNVQVNEPGDYCLIVTHGRGGVYCADTACVTVTQITGLPQTPQLAGTIGPCQGDTILYTATSTGNPPPNSFTWTTPNNQSYTSLSPDSIQIIWGGTGGQLCVVAANACGSSTPKCVPIVVAQAALLPQFAGPDSVCANGNGYLYLLDSLQPGTTYSWTAPPGATVVVTADTISIDFKNASSGQVCVTAQNSCGATAPVCQTVQVVPAPTADLSGIPEICSGETVNLTLALSGNAPFDVTWSDGNQQFVLNNISNGHQFNVSPTQTTTYKLIQVNDNSAPACSTPLTDSVQVSVWQPASTNQAMQICQGESLLLGGALQTASGIYFDTLNTIHGCDSVITTALTVNLIDTLYIFDTNCDPATTGTTTQVLSQANGCDSIVITTVSLLPTDTTLIFDKSCDPATVGTFVQALSNQFGCDSTVVTTITYVESDTTLISKTSCDINAVGVFYQNFTAADGCDSLIITTVSFLLSDTTLLYDQSCNPASTGVFTQTLTNQNGCDSTLITTISLAPLDSTYLTSSTCNPAAAGVFTQTLVTAGGCDSVLVTTVNLTPLDTTFLATTTCDPGSAGVFAQTLVTAGGCDSIIVNAVSLLPSDSTFITLHDCDPANTGTFVQPLSNAYGCDSTVVTTVLLLASDTTYLFDASCNPANVGVFMLSMNNQAGCDSTIITTVAFAPIDSTLLSSTTCDPGSAGVFTQNLVTPGGCDSVVITTVALLPSNQTAIQSTTCIPSEAGVFTYPLQNQFGCDSIVTETVSLLPRDTTYLSAFTCEPSEVGTSFVVKTNQWGCDSTVFTVTSLSPPATCNIFAESVGSTIPCNGNTGSLTLTVTLGEPPFSYTVKLGGANVTTGTIAGMGVPQPVTGLAPGNYTVVFTSSNGLTTTAQAEIIQLTSPDAAAIAASNYNGYPISCTGAADGKANATATGGATPYSFLWSDGRTTQQIGNLNAGTYTVTVTGANGCTDAGTVTLTEPAPVSMAFTVNDLDCFGQKDGAIFIQPSGGVPPYRYSLNSGTPQTSNAFAGLDAGSYSITVLDANDCETSDIIAVKAPVPLMVDLGDDVTIELGGNATLEAIVNVPYDSLASVIWSPAFDSSACPKCLTQTIAPLVSSAYSISVVANNGCRDDDRVIVIVDRTRHVYVPNIFSPNQDGTNDKFSIFAKPGMVRKIKSFQVFNRWGEAVYAFYDFDPNDQSIGWDGTFRGQTMSPGVFAWVAEIEFIDGVTEVFKGDVTLVR